MESRRTSGGPRQHTVATLGKLPGLEAQVHAGWNSVDELLEGTALVRQLELEDQRVAPQPPLWREVDVRGVRA